MFMRSAQALQPYFRELAAAGGALADMSVLRRIGLRAEQAMLAVTGGVNTHRGAIFGLGLLCAAAGARAAGARSHAIGTNDGAIDGVDPLRGGPGRAGPTLGEQVTRHWGAQILGGPRPSDSHGEVAGRRYGVGGARCEAAGGFASVYRVGVPALREAARLRPGEAADAHRAFVARRLSPGGAADLLAMSLFVEAMETATEVAADAVPDRSGAGR